MTAPEKSFSRWSRLKREANSRGRATADHDDTPVCSAGPQNRPPEAALDEGLADPQALPSIDAITIDTDIRAFLKSRVPADLARAALRRAWISDPAIRDFVGIAESQWDFNDPTAIPGFGPLLETDDVPALLARAFGQPAELVAAIAEFPVALEPPASTQIAGEIVPPDRPDTPNASIGTAAIAQPVVESEGSARSKRRAHGGALPR